MDSTGGQAAQSHPAEEQKIENNTSEEVKSSVSDAESSSQT